MPGLLGAATRGAAVTAIACAIGIPTFVPAAAQGTVGAVDDPCLSFTGTPTAGTVAARQAATPMPGAAAGGTPMAGMAHMMDLDLMYIDMMIPHHESIVALAKAAQPRLEDERLRDIADAIVSAQEAEIAELQNHRERFYEGSAPMPMDHGMMEAMASMMPGAGDMDDMAFQMDAAAQVAAFCRADDPDRAFIDLVIPHHEMAIVSSRPVAERAAHDELRGFAERVIADQEREIGELAAIRDELYGSATPEPVDSGS